MTMQQIEFDHLGLGTALARNRLRVPPNQREYSWGESHVRYLFQDLAEAIREKKQSYFLGTVVLTSGTNGTKEVADGQQRLATTTILLSAIRDYYHNQKKEMLVRAIEDKFLFEIDRKTQTQMPHLILNTGDNEFFRRRILSVPGSDERAFAARGPSNKRIDIAAKLAEKRVAEILKPYEERRHGDVLEEWTSFIENNAMVILVSVPDHLNAFIMFETLNDRGLKTSQSDLVKNHLFGEARDRSAEAQQRWSAMSGALETLGDEEDTTVTYLRHLLISREGHLREKDVFDRVRRASGQTEAMQFLDELAAAAVDYVATFTPDHPKWNAYRGSIRRSLRTLLQLRTKIMRPLILSLVRKFDERQLEVAIRRLVSWAVRLLIVGVGRSGTVEEGLAELAHSVTDGKIMSADDLARSADFIPADAQFRAEFESATVSQAYLARYYLRALELSSTDRPEPELIPNDDPVLTLEHVLPENPEANWPNIDPEIAAALYKRIGNMCLLPSTVNSDLRSAGIDTKISAYKDSGLTLTREIVQLASKGTWGVEEITKRQRKLAEIAVKAWPLS